MGKEFGKISREQAREVFSFLYAIQSEKAEVDEFIKEKKGKVPELLNQTVPWSYFYELPFNHLISLYLLTLISKTKAKKIFKSKDPVKALLDWASSDPKPPRGFSKWTINDMALFLALTMSVGFNIRSISMFNVPINNLLSKAKNNDDSSLFNAILVDKTVITSFTASKRISRAMLENDGQFFDQLAKAIKGSRPKRPAEKYDDLRFMMELLDRSVGLKNIAHKQLYNFLVEDLELYPEGGKDAMKGFEKFIERHLKGRST